MSWWAPGPTLPLARLSVTPGRGSPGRGGWCLSLFRENEGDAPETPYLAWLAALSTTTVESAVPLTSHEHSRRSFGGPLPGGRQAADTMSGTPCVEAGRSAQERALSLRSLGRNHVPRHEPRAGAWRIPSVAPSVEFDHNVWYRPLAPPGVRDTKQPSAPRSWRRSDVAERCGSRVPTGLTEAVPRVYLGPTMTSRAIGQSRRVGLTATSPATDPPGRRAGGVAWG